jgi:3D (Asp-Asp-Asp) domain-containing protein
MERKCYALAVGFVGIVITSCKTRMPSDSDGVAQASPALFPAPSQSQFPEPTNRSDSRRPDIPSAALALQLAAAHPLSQPVSAPPIQPPAQPPKSRPTAPLPAPARDEPAPKSGQTLSVRTTAYHRDEADHFTFGSMSAMGTPLKSRGPTRSAAADWSRFPAGTKFHIAGDPVIYEIDDYGSALVGTETIDLCQPDDFAMERWGAREVEIEILSWGSAEKSLSILKGRAGHEHVDQMIAALEPQMEGSQ